MDALGPLGVNQNQRSNGSTRRLNEKTLISLTPKQAPIIRLTSLLTANFG